MAATSTSSQGDVIKLQRFHAQHFPGQPVPQIQGKSEPTTQSNGQVNHNDLGCYPDGVRRTLTDEQIAMFRHSEIQRLLAERRKQRELEEEQRQKQERADYRKQQEGRRASAVASVSISRFDNDATVHGRPGVTALSYDEDEVLQDKQESKFFQWPLLGSGQ